MRKKVDYTQFQYKPFAFMLFVIRQKKWLWTIAIASVVLAGIMQALLYPLIKEISNSAITYESNPDAFIKIIVIFFGVLIMSNIFYRLSGWAAVSIIPSIEMFATQTSFDFLINHSAGYFSNNLSGKLQNKIANIGSAIHSMSIALLWEFLTLFVRMAAITIIAFIANVLIGYTFLLFFAVSIIYNLIASQKLAKYSRARAEQAAQVSGEVVDVVSNILAAKQNTALDRESKFIKASLGKYKKIHRIGWKYFDTTILVNNFIAVGMFGIIMFISLQLLGRGEINIGEIVMFFTMFLMIYGTVEFLSQSLNRFMENYGRLKDGLKSVFAPYDIVDSVDVKSVSVEKGEVIFENVEFHYNDDDKQSVLKDLSLTIPAGQKIGLVGESGAGKTTFVKLLLRFMDVERGEIKIGGYNIKNIKQNDLRRAITYVPQEALLFHRTLEENIRYSNPGATKEQLEKVISDAHAKEFIDSFPDKLGTFVGERGVKLSGGQKQRVMIARAMLKDAPILVLDEATSALDSMSEKLIQDALEKLMQDKTAIVVAHRLSTLRQMDRIIVFDDGQIVEDGTHEELLEQKGKYFELWQHQSGALQ